VIVYVMVAVGGIGKWFFFREGLPWLCLLVPLLCGPIFTANDMVAKSMIADLCDEDELRHGERREGVFGAMHGWVGKTAAALAIFAAGITLNVVGFDAARGAAQDPAALLRIRYILVVATVVPALIAIFLLRFYPLNEAKMAAVRAELERRRGTV
jgi:GPH family glycoside/pentoside/hexuronide:cation symporter